jgi:hypothetical protein
MANFLKGEQLNSELDKIFEHAHEQLIIISPFIKLHSRTKDTLKDKLTEPKLKITIVFGKNEKNKSKSLSLEEFNFFKGFPNIEIKYEPRLHAKYYANESSALLSSMNLYDYSQNNNIEFGILTTPPILGSLASGITGESLDQKAFSYFETVVKNSETKYLKEPLFEKKLMGLTKKHIRSDVKIDKLSTELVSKSLIKKKITPRSKPKSVQNGYCIRTGIKIPFDTKRPLSDKAFESWNKFKDENYPEKYCHYSGEKSKGGTSFAKPILKKNWAKAKGN